ncbi:hypothetical protein POM88_016603 [Heracleum sosnowskyi]|uniref:Uncharacterized protein n=1 Tax=Heracleum sosnowskyi TaxID=360622 RepID=A0AAD8MT41_9APIA|nr:hypothetical protein POM88_016603 [Heracleum sosnowskyi]
MIKIQSLSEPHFTDPDDNFSKDSILEAHLTDPDDDFEYNDDKPREECGVVGIFVDPEASRLYYLALHALQQRGQEGSRTLSLQKTLMGAGFKETKDENGKSTGPVTEKDEVVASTKDCCLHNRTLGVLGMWCG